jgi:hypothetical protein
MDLGLIDTGGGFDGGGGSSNGGGASGGWSLRARAATASALKVEVLTPGKAPMSLAEAVGAGVVATSGAGPGPRS